MRNQAAKLVRNLLRDPALGKRVVARALAQAATMEIRS